MSNRTKDYNSTYQLIFQTQPPHSANFAQSKADIISEGRGFVNAFDFTMQLQVGCPGGCLFCYVPSGDRLSPLGVKGEYGEKWGFVIRNKEKVIAKLEKHLYSGKLANKTIYWSGVTDPYAAPPTITKKLWESLNSTPTQYRPKRIIIQTRFRPDRDIELIRAYNQSTPTTDGGPPVLISYSIGTDRNDLIRAWEKSTPLFEQRMKAVENLRQAGIFVVVTLSPFGLWNNLRGNLKKFRSLGVTYLTCLFFKENTPSANTPNLFLKYLKEHYPLVLDRKWQLEHIQEMHDVYGKHLVLIGKPGFTSLAHPHKVL